MSVRREEADDRFFTLVRVLSACGVEAKKPDDRTGTHIPNGFGGTYNHARNGNSGGGQIIVYDSQMHRIEIRCFPARLAAVRGPTCPAFFADEVDGWLADEEIHANPAQLVIDGLYKRTTTQPETEAFVYSANYNGPESYHAKYIAAGDTIMEHTARLGPLGAMRDTEARARLAALIKSKDPRLLAPADPRDWRIAAWVGNPDKSSIETCYGLAKEDVGRMLWEYGGRPEEHKGKKGKGPAWTVADFNDLARANDALNAPARGANPMRADGLLSVPGYDAMGQPGGTGGGWHGL